MGRARGKADSVAKTSGELAETRDETPSASAAPHQGSLFEHQAAQPVGQPVAQPTRLATAAKAATAPDDDHLGHRQRLRERFRGGDMAVADYELLELILCRVFLQKDTKPLAKALLAEFKTFAEVLNAPPDRLKSIKGVGDRVVDELKLIRVAALKLTKGDIQKREVLSSWQAVLDYCKAAQGYSSVESFRILFLDKRNGMIADEVQQTGTVDHTPVYVREVVKRALDLGATSIILVHNHPSGDPTPSRADIDMTKMIADAGKPLGISVHDHIIVGRQGHASLKALRLF